MKPSTGNIEVSQLADHRRDLGITACCDNWMDLGIHKTTRYQMNLNELITGSLLGDGSVCKSYDKRQDTYNYYFSEGHSTKQEEYLKWKSNIFIDNGFNARLRIRQRTSKIKGRTISSEEISFHVSGNNFFKPLREKWYFDDIKQVPGDINLTPESIAVWYMDDGCYHLFRGTVALYTNGLNKQSQHILQKELKKFNINASIAIKGSGQDKKYYYLYLPRKEAYKLVTLVSPFIHPELNYKTPEGYELFLNSINKGKTISSKLPLNEAKKIIVDNILEFQEEYGHFAIIPYLFWEKSYSFKPIQRVFGSFNAAILTAGIRYSPCH